MNDRLQDSQEGIWLDFQNDTFVFFVQDEAYGNPDILPSIRRETQISFVQKGILDLFLVEIDDCLECSDLPLCMKDADDSVYEALQSDRLLGWQVVLCDENGVVKAQRDGSFTKENCAVLKTKLLQRKEEDYTAEDFENAYAKNSQRYEPYDFLQFAVFTQKEKQK